MTAIYQRARPATFSQVVGQDHVKDVLVAALQRGKASHAYLFSGPRGVGKTTTARLLAMALNCENSGAQIPCGECESCRLVREGSHPDVIELDAASNNSVEDVRELRERTTLASMRGGSRVWILDEAHMLSRAASNALLKTLEEPPPGLVFVLATTEPEKLPPTVLSRCQHYRFRRLSEPEIRGKLERLCAEAGVEAEEEALALVARAADGAMRDAESLLERLLTPGTTITAADAEEALGLPPAHRIARLASALAVQDLDTLFSEAEALYRDGFAPRSLAENLTRSLRDTLREMVLADGGQVVETQERLPLGASQLLRLIHALDDEQDRFVRKDDLYSLEVALLKGVNTLAGNRPGAAEAADRAAETLQAGSESTRRENASANRPPVDGGPGANGSGTGSEQPGQKPGDPSGQSASEGPAGDAHEPETTKPAPRQETASRVGDTPDGDTRVGDTPVGDTPPRAAETGGTSDRTEGATGAGAEDAETSSSVEGGADGARTSSSAGSAGAGEASRTGRAPGASLDWRAVRNAASPQLKAFLMPAREAVEGDQVVVSYDETHRFHYSQLVKNRQELEALIEQVAGPGYRLRILGPEESATKKS